MLVESDKSVGRHFRRSPRQARRVDLRYALVEGGEPGTPLSGHTDNIGVGGAFVITPDPLPLGSTVLMELQLPTGRAIEARGEVRWVADGEQDAVLGMGVRFHGLSEEELQVLNEYFATLTATVDYDEAT